MITTTTILYSIEILRKRLISNRIKYSKKREQKKKRKRKEDSWCYGQHHYNSLQKIFSSNHIIWENVWGSKIAPLIKNYKKLFYTMKYNK